MSGRARSLAGRLALLALGTLVACGAAELLLRARGAGTPALHGLHRVRPDRPWLYDLEPGAERHLSLPAPATYAINADGFRGPRYARPKPEGVFRAVVLGDSLAFGYGVEEEAAFPARLERRLASLADAGRIEVVNLGVGGYNAYNEAALFRELGVTYEPDLVLVQFCINDLNDPTLHFDGNTRMALGDIPDEAFPNPAERRPPPSALGRACERSRLCALARGAWRDPAAGAALRAAFAPRDRGEHRTEWRWLGARYAEMAGAAERVGARFAVLAFPYRDQIESGAGERVRAELAALGARRGLPVVDLAPAFRAAREAGGGPLFLDVWHPTARGHAVAADAIARVLACEGLVPGAARSCGDAVAGDPGPDAD